MLQNGILVQPIEARDTRGPGFVSDLQTSSPDPLSIPLSMVVGPQVRQHTYSLQFYSEQV